MLDPSEESKGLITSLKLKLKSFVANKPVKNEEVHQSTDESTTSELLDRAQEQVQVCNPEVARRKKSKAARS